MNFLALMVIYIDVHISASNCMEGIRKIHAEYVGNF